MSRLRVASSGIRCLGTILALALSTEAQLVFNDMAPATGTTNLSWGRGSAMVDLDGDGLLDLIAGNAGMDNAFLRQLPDRTFSPMNQAWGIPAGDDRYTWGTLVADFDNDGDPDVYFVNGGFLGTNHPNQYLRNDLDSLGVFTDVPAGAATEPSTNFGGTAFDYDRDGDLDLFVTTTWEQDGACLLLENDGNAVFTDVSAAAGITHTGDFRHCTMGDIDNDGWFDVAVGGWFHNRVYRNNGDGTFAEVSEQVGLALPSNKSFGLVLDDFDNDGWTDAYVPRYQLGELDGPSQLLVNDGTGAFLDVTSGSGMTAQADMGHSSGDLDADGFPDIYIGTGKPTAEAPDLMFRVTPNGAGGLSAIDVSVSSGILSNGPTRCHGMAFGDYDGDGFVDIYVNNGGPDWTTASTLEENFLWKNQGNANYWTALRLTGVISNKSAIGAKAVAIADSGERVFRVRRAGHGFANSDSPILHFGMGAARTVDRIEIQWPSGIVQEVSPIHAGTTLDVLETGIVLSFDPVAPGDGFEVKVAGPPGASVTLGQESNLSSTPGPLGSSGSASQGGPVQEISGRSALLLVVFSTTSLVLDANGTAVTTATVVNDPNLSGTSVELSAEIEGVGVSSVLLHIQ